MNFGFCFQVRNHLRGCRSFSVVFFSSLLIFKYIFHPDECWGSKNKGAWNITTVGMNFNFTAFSLSREEKSFCCCFFALPLFFFLCRGHSGLIYFGEDFMFEEFSLFSGCG